MDLQQWLHDNGPKRARPLKVEWFHNGVDLKGSATSDNLSADTMQLLERFRSSLSFLMVATIEPRKGHAQTIAAFELLWSQGLNVNLVIVGKQGWMVEQLMGRIRTHPELRKRLFWLGGISDGYLDHVYAACRCLIAASLGEGFGLPLIEAAQHKLPIIARDIPVFREVAGEHAHYFSGMSPRDMSDAIKTWLVLYEKAKHPKSDNMPWLTWKQSTRMLLEKILGPQHGIEEETAPHRQAGRTTGVMV